MEVAPGSLILLSAGGPDEKKRELSLAGMLTVKVENMEPLVEGEGVGNHCHSNIPNLVRCVKLINTTNLPGVSPQTTIKNSYNANRGM